MTRRRMFRTAVLGSVVAIILPAAAMAADGGATAAPTDKGRKVTQVQPGDLPARLGQVKGRPLGKLGTDVLTAQGRVPVYVELTSRPAAAAYKSALSRGRPAAKRAALSARASAKQATTAVTTDIRRTDSKARVLYRTSNAAVGVAVLADADTLRRLASRGDVRHIARLVPKRLENASAAQLTRVLQSWQDFGLLGQGIKLGVIDSGVDYTHANFGGPGTVAAFEAVDPTSAAGVFPTAKVVGGWDFAGEGYDADSDDPAVNTPVPDDNPLDCDGHGSHVAGTATGLGVNDNGSTFSGNYRNLTGSYLDGMRIGPGMAPKAKLYALKVFGCPEGGAGSTFLVAAALDWTLDPNGDGDFRDHLDVVNISIGADYSAPDDPDNLVTERVIGHGVMPIFSAGNGGNFYDIGSEAPDAMSVASSRDAFELRDALQVVAPASLVGKQPGQYSVALDYAGVDVTDDVVNLSDPANLDGCNALSAADAARVSGKIAWLEWDDNDATRRCGSVARSANVVAAGATGAIFTSTLEHFSAGITGSAVVPVIQLTGSATNALRPAMAAGTLKVRMAGELAASLKSTDPAIEDTTSSFTSRGTRSPVVRPDIAAPGDTIVSTKLGSGNLPFSNSGTSMASPHVTGIAALVRQAHPGWGPRAVKAALMNTANHEVYSHDGPSGPIEAPNRVGSGRIDARQALANLVLAYDRDRPGSVSVGFGVVEVSEPTSITRTIELRNTGPFDATYKVVVRRGDVDPRRELRVRQVLRGGASVRHRQGQGHPADQAPRCAAQDGRRDDREAPARRAAAVPGGRVRSGHLQAGQGCLGLAQSAGLLGAEAGLGDRGAQQGQAAQGRPGVVHARRAWAQPGQRRRALPVAGQRARARGDEPGTPGLQRLRHVGLRRERHRPWWRPPLRRGGIDGS